MIAGSMTLETAVSRMTVEMKKSDFQAGIVWPRIIIGFMLFRLDLTSLP